MYNCCPKPLNNSPKVSMLHTVDSVDVQVSLQSPGRDASGPSGSAASDFAFAAAGCANAAGDLEGGRNDWRSWESAYHTYIYIYTCIYR